jgi:sugar O-acyltransferase (sialic acid O-acetyltransferase NeuD family)
MAPLYVFGGGGHARVVVATAVAVGFEVAGIFDDDASLAGSSVDGVPVLGPFEGTVPEDARCIIAVGNNQTRARIAGRLEGCVFASVVHPRATVHETVRLGHGTVVFAGAVIQPGTTIGRHGIVNTAATIDHDCTLGDFVHVAPGVHLAGNVALGDRAFMGIASAAIPGVRIGADATVGAGGIVVSDIPPDVTAVGIPAKPSNAR